MYRPESLYFHCKFPVPIKFYQVKLDMSRLILSQKPTKTRKAAVDFVTKTNHRWISVDIWSLRIAYKISKTIQNVFPNFHEILKYLLLFRYVFAIMNTPSKSPCRAVPESSALRHRGFCIFVSIKRWQKYAKADDSYANLIADNVIHEYRMY